MKTKLKSGKEFEISILKVKLPVRYGDEDIPYDFPLRKDKWWKAKIKIENGKIIDWPKGIAGNLNPNFA